MTVERRFDVDGENGRPKGEAEERAPVAGQPTPTAPLPRASGRKRTTERRTPRPRRGKRQAKAADTTRPTGLVFLFKPGFLLLVGAVVLGVLWAAGLFHAVDGWPWSLFTEDGSVAIRWGPAQAYTLLGAFLVAFFLVASFCPSSKGRGRAILVVAALGLVPFWPGQSPVLLVGAALLGVVGGALIAQSGAGAGRGLLFAALILLAACLFFPAGAGEAYTSPGWDVGQELFGPGENTSIGDVLLTPRHALVILLCLLLVVGLLSWVGLGGRWVLWTGGVLLFVAVLAPLVLRYLEITRGEADISAEAALRHLARGLNTEVTAFLALALPLSAGVIDSARRDRD